MILYSAVIGLLILPLAVLAGETSQSFTYTLTSGDPSMVVSIPDNVTVSVAAETDAGVSCLVKVYGPEQPSAGSGVRKSAASGTGSASFRSASGAKDYLVVVTPKVTGNETVYRKIKNGGSIQVTIKVKW